MIRVDEKLQKPRVRFDPAFYRHARKRYDQGDHGPFIAMMQEAARDAYVSGLLVGRAAGYKQRYALTPPPGVEIKDERIMWLERDLKRLQIYRLLEALHQAELYRYVVVDFEWEVIDGRQVPIDFTRHDQHHFAYKGRELMLRRGGELVPIVEDGTFAVVAETKEDPVMLPIVREYILMEFGIEAWAAFLENFGEGIIIGKYPPGASEQFRQEVDDAVNQIGQSSRGSAPEGTTFEIHESRRNTGDHDRFRREAKVAASVGLLGHGNAAEQATGTQIGDNQTSLQVRREIAEDDMRVLEPLVQRLVDEYWRRNYGGPAPEFELDKKRPLNVREELDKIDTAWRHGVALHVSNYSKLGLRVDETVEWIQRPELPSFLD